MLACSALWALCQTQELQDTHWHHSIAPGLVHWSGRARRFPRGTPSIPVPAHPGPGRAHGALHATCGRGLCLRLSPLGPLPEPSDETQKGKFQLILPGFDRLEAALDETAALLLVSPGASLPQSSRATTDALIARFSEFCRNHVAISAQIVAAGCGNPLLAAQTIGCCNGTKPSKRTRMANW